MWVRGQQDAGAEPASVQRRLSALSSFYRYCAAHDLTGQIRLPGRAAGRGPGLHRDVGLAREQARALVAAADTDGGPQALRTAAAIRLLLHNALRVDEACAAEPNRDRGVDLPNGVFARPRLELIESAASGRYLPPVRLSSTQVASERLCRDAAAQR
jgi:site-specific recombinase XerC